MKPTLLILRNGVIGGLLLVLSRALDTVLYYLNGYVLLLILVGLLVSTASTTRKIQPESKLGTTVFICWGVYLLAMVIMQVHLRLFYPTYGNQVVISSLVSLFASGGILSLLVVSVCLLVMPTHK